MAHESNAQARQVPAVLVIDDEDYVADMIAAALELEGFVVYVAYNGREGLERAHTLRLDLVVVDIMMPYMNGETLSLKLRQLAQTRDVPIVLISAGARPRQNLSNVTFMAKPFDIDEMVDLVKQQIGRSRGHGGAEAG